MSKERLLTDEEIHEAHIQWFKKPKAPTYEKHLFATQDIKTRQATLREVGEWLEIVLCYGGITEEHIAKLKQGEMP